MSEINYVNRNIFITFMQYFMEPILFLLLNAILDIFFQTWKRKIFIIFRLQQTTTFIDNMS
jgi:hypothetical protein